MSATPTCFKMMATADSKGASSQHYIFRGHQTCPRVTLTVDYDAKSTSKTPTSPKDLHDAIVSRGVSAACMHAPRQAVLCRAVCCALLKNLAGTRTGPEVLI